MRFAGLLVSGATIWLCAGPSAWAQTRSGFAGTYTFRGQLELKLQQTGRRVVGALTAKGKTLTVRGRVTNGVLSATASDGKNRERITARLTSAGIVLRQRGGAAVTFTRVVRDSRAIRRPGRPRDVRRPRVAAARGPRYRSHSGGWRLRVPRRWTYTQTGGRLILKSKREAGLIVVAFQPGAGQAKVLAQLGKGIHSKSIQLDVSGRTQRWRRNAGTAIAANLAGRAGDGSRLAGRWVGVVGSTGVVVVVGIATPTRITGLTRRVHALARTIRFVRPPRARPRSRTNKTLTASWWYYHGSTSGLTTFSSERRIVLCPDGSFRDSSSTSYAATSAPPGGVGLPGSYAGEGKGAGRWTVAGNGRRGKVTLRFRDGRTEALRYEFYRKRRYCSNRGCDINFNGRHYGREAIGKRCR